MRFGVSYFGVRDPRHARRDLDEIAEAGFTSITHTFSEHDLRYHQEDVGRLVDESKSRGLEVGLDPWGVGGLFGGEAYSEHALVDLEARQVDANGVSVPASCPNARSTRELLRRWTAAAAELDPDLLFWDEPHFYLGALRPGPVAACCRCEACRTAWLESGGEGPLPEEGDARLARFRGATLRRFLADAIAVAPKDLKHSLCLLPHGEFDAAGSDAWSEFASLPGLSRLGTDPYWMERPVDPVEFVRHHVQPLHTVCRETGLEMEVWIQGIRIPAGQEQVLIRATEAAVQEGAQVVSYWSFRGTERMATLRCGDPDQAWNAMKESVRRFR